MRSKGWRGPFATLMKALFILGALMMLVAVPFGLSFSSLRGRAKYGLAGKSSGVRELQVRRFSDLNPVAQATREQAAEVIKDMPFTAAPGDLMGGALQIIVIPFFLGVFIVYLVTVFKPDMILTDNQMVEYKKAERKYFLEKKGAVKDPDEPAEMNRASRRAKSLKGKRHVPLWAQRSSSEITLAKRLRLELAIRLAECRGDVTDFMTSFALKKCLDARTALTFFRLLRDAVRQGEQRFSLDDISTSEESCLSTLAQRRSVHRRRASDDSSEEGLEGGRDFSDSELSGEEAPEKEPQLQVTPQLADLGVEATTEELKTEWYPSHLWETESSHVLPGTPGFNRRATNVLRRAGLGQPPSQKSDSRPLQPHQEIVRFLVHPASPVQRLLVDHPTGSGKTREMVSILENFFYDQRPKIAIFPKAAICRNFYRELLRWPNRYRDYFCCQRPVDATQASGGIWQNARHEVWDLTRLPEETVRHLIRSFREVLEMKGQSFRGLMRKSFRAEFKARNPGEPMPLSPLVAISYASAGGSYAAMTHGQHGQP
ncbi:unnamed protein product, partial [Durusdinium trenchii]